jgi:glycosyltransferase involved in cell wall biosynthesis
MRVAIIAEVFLPKVDGVVNRTVRLIRELVQCDDQVLVVCPRAPGRQPCDVPIVECRSFPFRLYPEYFIGLPDKHLAAAVARFAPDILHFVNPFAFGFRCYDKFCRAGLLRPTVFSFHTLYGEFVKQYPGLKPLSRVLWWMTREYHNCANVNVTVSQAMQDELVLRGFRRVRCWPPAVDGRLFCPERRSVEVRRFLTGDRPNGPLLLTVARLAPEKNIGMLATILRQVPGCRMAVVGDGPQRAELERRFADLDVRFVGYLKGEELAAAYASADAFLYASETETMGNVVLEAMASGLPVIAPRAGGIPSLVDHDRTGLLYSPRDVDEAAQLTRDVITDPVLRSRLGRAARATVEGWDWKHSVGRVREFYREAIEVFQPDRGKRRLAHRSAGVMTATLVSAFRAGAAVGRDARYAGPCRAPKKWSGGALGSRPGQRLTGMGVAARMDP